MVILESSYMDHKIKILFKENFLQFFFTSQNFLLKKTKISFLDQINSMSYFKVYLQFFLFIFPKKKKKSFLKVI